MLKANAEKILTSKIIAISPAIETSSANTFRGATSNFLEPNMNFSYSETE